MTKDQTEVGAALRLMAGSVLDAVVAVDHAGRIVAWNAVAEQTFGWSRDEALGKPIGVLIVPPQHREAHNSGMRRYQETGDARVVNRRIEITAMRKGGGEFPVELSIIPLAADGQTLFVGFLRDISERRQAAARHAFMLELSDLLRSADAERALQDACGLMGQYFQAARVGYGQLDPSHDVFDYSICWTDGAVPPLLGRYPASAFGPQIVAKLNRGETVVVEDLFADPLSSEIETQATASAVDTRSILVVPFLRAGRLRTIVYLNDRLPRQWTGDEVTFMEEVAERTRQVIERSEAEAALRELNATLEAHVEARTADLRAAEEALRQAHKMEAIGQLTGGIAHDFNNLLQGITGSLDLMQKRISQGRLGELDRFITGAMTSANRAAALTHRLLAFARRQPLAPRTIRANPLIASMEDLLRRTLGEQVDLELALAEDLWLSQCDPNQLEAAILNLAINARDAMPDGGKLIIETENAHLDSAYSAKQRDVRPGQYICIAVTDTGVGMSQDTLAKAFEPFFTTKPIGQGTGLGLSMIYGFAQQSEGYAKIYSEVGQGTTFRLYLPRFQGEAEAEAASEGPALANGRGSGEAVLVVEDEPVIRGLIAEVLADLGYQVLEAADGPAGVALLQSSRRIDLLVTDVGLPGLNGRQIAEAGRAARPDLKVLFMTGYAANAAFASGVLHPGMAMITKPFAMQTLAARVREIIEVQQR